MSNRNLIVPNHLWASPGLSRPRSFSTDLQSSALPGTSEFDSKEQTLSWASEQPYARHPPQVPDHSLRNGEPSGAAGTSLPFSARSGGSGGGRYQGGAAGHQRRPPGRQGSRQSVQSGDRGRPLLRHLLRLWRHPPTPRGGRSSPRGAHHSHHPLPFRSHAGTRSVDLQRLGERAARADRGVGGPTPVGKIVSSFLDSVGFDIDIRMADEGRPDLRKLVAVHEFEAPPSPFLPPEAGQAKLIYPPAAGSAGAAATMFEREGVKVSAARVRHPPISHAYAYRFDASDRAIVLSGDTTYSPELIALAKGADVLVHEVMHLGALDRLLSRVPNAPSLCAHLIDSHTTTEQLGASRLRRAPRNWCSATSCLAMTPPSRTLCGLKTCERISPARSCLAAIS
jgi:hypothetical protein